MSILNQFNSCSRPSQKQFYQNEAKEALIDLRGDESQKNDSQKQDQKICRN